ncbi:MAG: alpha-E domain-containing protein [Candidatus Obscuribacterales bacterium]|nr:alpha-E domain-containing protein [Candidatus Obscuribacterales bacterium]
MISRVAESCFWMLRHLERAESTAHMLKVNRSFILDINLPALERWYPFIIVAGEKENFKERFEEKQRHDGELVQNYLVWDEENQVSIRNALFWARENARTIREVISLEMWETINGLWHWISSAQASRLYKSNRDRFYKTIITEINSIHGVSYNTQSHETPFDFMQLGMQLERAGQIARILDVKYHAIGPTKIDIESPIEAAQWLALLRSCSAQDAFLKRSKTGIAGPAVFEFLVRNRHFPRSVLYCLLRADKFMQRIRPDKEADEDFKSRQALMKVVRHITSTTTQETLERGIHNELTFIVDSTIEICAAVHHDFFDPEIPSEVVEIEEPSLFLR